MLPQRDGSGKAPVTIKKGKIRGEVSHGMICAEDEIGLGESHAGILVLADAAPVGLPLADWLRQRGELPGDAVLDVAVTPNRPDATSHVGVARDVAALTDRPLVLPQVEVPEAGGEAADLVSVEIESPETCPRFVGMVVRGVAVGPSPEWMQARLRAVGLRPISNVVDVTNYVMLETGQPLHAYDLDRLAGRRVVVRQLDADETLTTLDGAERTLPAGTTVVADAERTVGIAGVMGGLRERGHGRHEHGLHRGRHVGPGRDPPGPPRRSGSRPTPATASSAARTRPAKRAPWPGPPRSWPRPAGGEVVPGLVDENPVPYTPRTVRLRPVARGARAGRQGARGRDRPPPHRHRVRGGRRRGELARRLCRGRHAGGGRRRGGPGRGRDRPARDRPPHSGPTSSARSTWSRKSPGCGGTTTSRSPPRRRSRSCRGRTHAARPAPRARPPAAGGARVPRAGDELARLEADGRGVRRRRLDRPRRAARRDPQPDLAGDGRAPAVAPAGPRRRHGVQRGAGRRADAVFRGRPGLPPGGLGRGVRRRRGVPRAHGACGGDERAGRAPVVERPRTRDRLL